jgi:CubicO group peptidase (beta-lactamase class C family)
LLGIALHKGALASLDQAVYSLFGAVRAFADPDAEPGRATRLVPVHTLDLPMVRKPGEAGVYCTAGINLIGGVLRKATGISLPRFFHESFAEPMGISYYQMNLSPTYVGYMRGGIRLRPRDFRKLGQLYLDGGAWKGHRIVSEDWVRESFAPHASLNESADYGFAWWRRRCEVGGQTIDTYYASGNGGQFLLVVPELDLVALIQAGNYSANRTSSRA